MPFWKTYAAHTCPHGLHVYLVDGFYVRDRFDSDFSQGGNGYCYSWIPKNEIWIDGHLPEAEWPIIEYHECREVEFMKQGMSYDKAHTKAKKLEGQLRRDLGSHFVF